MCAWAGRPSTALLPTYWPRHYGLGPNEVIFVGDSLMDYKFVRDKEVRFIALRRLFQEHDFRDRGLFSVRDLTALASMWRRSEGVIHFVDRVRSQLVYYFSKFPCRTTSGSGASRVMIWKT